MTNEEIWMTMNYQACFATHSLRELLVVICVLSNVSIVSRKIQVLMKRINIFRDICFDCKKYLTLISNAK